MTLPKLAPIGAIVCVIAACEPQPIDPVATSSDSPLEVEPNVGVRQLPDAAYLNNAEGPCTLYVAAGVSGGDGTQANPFGSVSSAAAAAKAGSVICVAPGVYSANVSIATTHANGTAQAPIVMRAQNPDQPPTLRSNANAPVLKVARSFWAFRGLDIDMNQKSHHAIFIDGTQTVPVHHVAVQRCNIHGTGGTSATSGIATRFANDVTIVENSIHDNNRVTASGIRSDSNGVYVLEGCNRIDASRNRIWDNSGDGIHCAPAGRSYDILLEGNEIFTTEQKRGTNENAVDLKNCSYVTIRGGSYYGFRLATGEGGNTAQGEAIVIHYEALDVLVEDARIRDVCRGIAIGRSSTGEGTVDGVIIRRNLIYDIPVDLSSGCKGDGIVLTRANNVDVHNNTFVNVGGPVFRVGRDNSVKVPPVPASNVEFWNNVISTGGEWIDYTSNDSQLVLFESDFNLFYNTQQSGDRMYIDGVRSSMAGWRTTVGSDTNSVVANPNFRPGADYCLASGSPAINVGSSLDGSASQACGSTDMGWVESDCATCPPGSEPPPPPPSGDATVAFQHGVLPSAAYAGGADTYILEDQPAGVFNTQSTLMVDGDDPSTSGRDATALVAWDLSGYIPAGSVVTDAKITFRVLGTSTQAYPMYEVLRGWLAGSTTWLQAAAGMAWQVPGATGNLDRGSTAVASIVGNASEVTVTLNSAGRAMVQRWLDDPASNHGIVISSTSNTDGLDLASNQNATGAYRPRLTLTYTSGGSSSPPLFVDDFNRTTGLGPNWSIRYGAFATDGAFAVSQTPPVNGNWARLVPAIGTADYAVTTDIVVPASSSYSGVFARSMDAANADRDLYAAQLSTASGGSVNLYRRNAYKWLQLASVPLPVVAGTKYALRLQVGGTDPVRLLVAVDGVARIAFDDSSSSRLATGVPGIQNYDTGVKYDSFRVDPP